MKVALTGATGFLGIHLVEALRNRGYTVKVLRRTGSVHPLMKTLPEGAVFSDVDFNSEDSLVAALKDCSAVIHAAGLVSYSKKEQALMQISNVTITQNVLNAARKSGIKRFIHVSSIVTIGYDSGSPVMPKNEASQFDAQELGLAYWTTKQEAEKFVLSQNSAGFETVVVNPGSLLGRGERSNQFLPFLKKLGSSMKPVLPSGGSDFVDVRDAALGTVLALEKGRPGERYILGCENLTYKAFYMKLRSVQGLTGNPRVLPQWFLSAVALVLKAIETIFKIDLPVNSARIKRVNGICMFHDCSKAKKELGYNPRPIDDALRIMLKE